MPEEFKDFEPSRDSYIVRNSILKKGDQPSLENELEFCDKMRMQFEKFLRDLEYYNASKKDPALKRIVDYMERFNDDMSRLNIFVRDRHNYFNLIEENFKDEKEELEIRIQELEADFNKQLEMNNRLGDELNKRIMEENKENELSVLEQSRMKTEMLVIEDYSKDLEEYGIRIRDLEVENSDLKSELNQKYFDINELKSEIKDLNGKMANLMDMKMAENEEKEKKSLINEYEEKRMEEFREAVRNSNALMQKVDRMSMRKGSINSTQSQYAEKVEELEDMLSEERNFIASLKMELEGLKRKNEDLEDQLMERAEGGNLGGFGRLDSNLMNSNFEVDEDILESGIGDSLMDVDFGKRTMVRKVRDHKNIQVDLVMANVIMEEEELEFEIMKVRVIADTNNEVEKIMVTFLYNDELGEVHLRNDKIEIEGSLIKEKKVIKEVVKEVVKEVEKEGEDEAVLELKGILSKKGEEIKNLEVKLGKAKNSEQAWYDRCAELQGVLDKIVAEGASVSNKEIQKVRDELNIVILDKQKEIQDMKKREEDGKLIAQGNEDKLREELALAKKLGEEAKRVDVVQEKPQEVEEVVQRHVEEEVVEAEEEVQGEQIEDSQEEQMEEQNIEESVVVEETQPVAETEIIEQKPKAIEIPTQTPQLLQESEVFAQVTIEQPKASIEPVEKSEKTNELLKDLQTTLDSKEKELESLKTELASVKEREDKWFNKCSDLQKQLENSILVEKKQQESEMGELTKQNQDLKTELEGLQSKLEELQKELKENNRTLGQKDNIIKNLESEIDFSKKNYKELKDSYLEKIGHLESIIDKLKESGNEGEALKEKIQEMEKMSKKIENNQNIEKKKEEFKKEVKKTELKNNISKKKNNFFSGNTEDRKIQSEAKEGRSQI